MNYKRLIVRDKWVEEIKKQLPGIVDEVFNTLNKRGEKIKPKKTMICTPQLISSEESEHALEIEISTSCSPELKGIALKGKIIKKLKGLKILPTNMWTKKQVFVFVHLKKAPVAKELA